MPTLCRKLKAQDAVFGEIHVGSKHVGVGTEQIFTLTVTGKRSMAKLVVLERNVAISREGTGEDGDVANNTLGGLVENVGDLVLEVLSCNERVEQQRTNSPF